MKKFLLAGAALAVSGAAAFALDDDGVSRTRVHVSADSDAMFMGDDGQIVEIRGANGDRTIHIDRDGERSVIRIDGQEIEIVDGTVLIDGDAVEVSPNSVVIIEGDQVRVVEGRRVRMDREFEVHMAERAQHLAEMENHLANMAIELDIDGVGHGVLESLTLALEGLHEDRILQSRDWDELSAVEQAEVRAELESARVEMRAAMEEVRRELRDSHAGADGDRRRVRVEIQNAAREMARAEREIARERVLDRAHAERDRAHAERDAARAEREHAAMIHADTERLHQLLGDSDARDIRVEDSDGRQRVWIDGEEQTGDDLVEWLNLLEVDRLSGGRLEGSTDDRDVRRNVRVERIQRTEGRRVIDLDDGQRVVILEYTSEDKDD